MQSCAPYAGAQCCHYGSNTVAYRTLVCIAGENGVVGLINTTSVWQTQDQVVAKTGRRIALQLPRFGVCRQSSLATLTGWLLDVHRLIRHLVLNTGGELATWLYGYYQTTLQHQWRRAGPPDAWCRLVQYHSLAATAGTPSADTVNRKCCLGVGNHSSPP